MSVYIDFIAPSGEGNSRYAVTIERLSDGFFREDDNNNFSAGIPFDEKAIFLTEGSNENRGCYIANVSSSGWIDGLYRARVHDTAFANSVVGSELFGVKNGVEVEPGNESYVFDLYHGKFFFLIDDTNNQDEYTVVLYKNNQLNTASVIGATIEVFKRDGTNLFSKQNMTNLGSANNKFIYNAPSGSRAVGGETYFADVAISGADFLFTNSFLFGRDNDL